MFHSSNTPMLRSKKWCSQLGRRFQNTVAAFALFFSSTIFLGCSSQPIVPEAKNIEISREDADKDCKEIGVVQGSVSTRQGTIEQAIEDMKLDAARKGANYVRMETTSAMGTSVRGTAYQCP